jgi:hypothetical protein
VCVSDSRDNLIKKQDHPGMCALFLLTVGSGLLFRAVLHLHNIDLSTG